MIRKFFNIIKQGLLIDVILRKLGLVYDHKLIQRNINIALSKKSTEGLSAIERALTKTIISPVLQDKGLPKDFIKLLAGFILSRRSGYLPLENDYSNLIKQAEALDPFLLSCNEWNKVCKIAIYNGLFELSRVMRNKALENALSFNGKDQLKSSRQIELLRALVDQGDFLAAETVLSVLCREMKEKDFINKAYIYLNIMKGEHEKACELAGNDYSVNDQAFAEYIRGKSIAVVGPAPSEEILAEEIDTYDIVVRINYRGVEHTPNQDEFGSKLDVSYYNGECAAIINEMGNKLFFDDLDYACFKKVKHEYQEKLIEKGNGRAIYEPDAFIFSGSLNMLQNSLFDLLCFKPSKIKVFKVNFYLAQKTHYTGYSPHENRAGYEWIWTAFANHNFISQINFVKQLWRSKMIDVDESCAAVLNLPEAEYVSKMEEVHVTRPLLLLDGKNSANWNALQYKVID